MSREGTIADAYLTQMLIMPELFATSLGALDGMVWLALNIDADARDMPPRTVQNHQRNYIATNYPDCGSQPLFEHLSHLDLPEYAQVLKKWVDQYKADTAQ